jgi:hypothetical protein
MNVINSTIPEQFKKRNVKLPVKYSQLSIEEKRFVREMYKKIQGNKCFYCKESLDILPPESITKKKIDWSLFPPNFLKYPIHLQHNHVTDLTEGAVHAYCNAVLWQYEGR